MTAPIKPTEVSEAFKAALPPKVIETWNAMIAKACSKNSAQSGRITQDEAIAQLQAKMGISSRQYIFDSGWLDIEPIYREAGWQVTYDKPGYNESYKATFIFKPKG